MILKVILPNRGKKECYQVVNLSDEIKDSEIISSIAKQISGKDVCIRNKDYFIKK